MTEQEKQPPILSRLQPPAGAVRPARRVGRGPGSGLGKTAGKGQKGQKARSPGNFSKLHFEGGQTPLQRRLPKIGFKSPFPKKVAIVNVETLDRFESGAKVDIDLLMKTRVVRGQFDSVKVLGRGEITKKFDVVANSVSSGARKKIEAAGGTVTIVEIKTASSNTNAAGRFAKAGAAGTRN